jgi:hypothetical protein
MPKSRKKQVEELLKPYLMEVPELAKELSEKIVLIFKKKQSNWDESELHNRCRKFFTEYCIQNDFECQWTHQYGMSLNLLLKKLKTSYEKRYNVYATEDNIYEGFTVLIKLLPEWYRSRMYLPTINSNYDGIINTIKSKPQDAKSKTTAHNRDQAERIARGEL